jgi:hypothetical protein
LLKNHSGLAVYNLNQLSKRQARQFSGSIDLLKNGALPWRIGLLIDATGHTRSTRHTDNAQRLNHGKGFFIGHQWTNIALFINDMLIPLPPIPFHTRRYCRKNALPYRTENQAVIQYLERLDLEQYIGPHNPREVVVLADSGYDDRRIQRTIDNKNWIYIIALKKRRGVRSLKTEKSTPLSNGWLWVEQFFKNHRSVKWQTIRLLYERIKKKANGVSHTTNHGLSALCG